VPGVSPRANRLPTPHWLDARLVIGVVLVLLAVVAGARVFAGADRETTVYLARRALVPGEHLDRSDLSIGRIRFDGQGRSYIGANGTPPVGYVVTRYVGPGELVPLSALASTATIAPTRLVTVPVPPGHLPQGLGHGDLVDLYVTPKVTGSATGAATSPPPIRVLASVAVDSDDGGAAARSGGSTVSVVLVVPVGQVTAVISAVESGTIDVVEVPAVTAAGLAPTSPASPSGASPAAPASASAAAAAPRQSASPTLSPR
jgi:hypothetical protein